MPIRYDPRSRLTGSSIGGMVSSWNRFALVKSIQTGTVDMTISTSVTATITAVDVTKSEVFNAGQVIGVSSGDAKYLWRVSLTNATTVTGDNLEAPGGSSPARYVVREMYPGVIRSVQRSGVGLNGGTSATITITAVVPGKTIVTHQGYNFNQVAVDFQKMTSSVVLTNATTVTFSVGTNPTVQNDAYMQATEYY